MKILLDVTLSETQQCPYLPDKELRYSYFYAHEVNQDELEVLLSQGWRKFGYYYFKPNCPNCNACVPLRIMVDEFEPSRSQKRVIKKGKDIEMFPIPLRYKGEIYAVYRDHSMARFGRVSTEEEFLTSFYRISCPGFQTEYYYNNRLAAVGFLDRSVHALSSVYFVYHHDLEEFSPGTLSICREIEEAKEMGSKWYYLGYYIENNQSMNYKNRFYPHERLDMTSGEWTRYSK
jgi:leucyl-tRNA---protein transferase